MNKKICSVLLTLVLLFLTSFVVISDNDYKIKYQTRIIGGTCNITGYIPSLKSGEQVTILVLSNIDQPLTANKIVWINQMTTGVNGAFSWSFGYRNRLNQINIEQPIYVRIGGADPKLPSTPETITVQLLATGGKLSQVPNNSLRIGYDVYDLASPDIKPENVVESVRDGGNTLFFKFNNNWFNLLDPKCNNSNYLISGNAIPSATYNAWTLNRWFRSGVVPTYFE